MPSFSPSISTAKRDKTAKEFLWLRLIYGIAVLPDKIDQVGSEP
jgi:hypothetical protein